MNSKLIITILFVLSSAAAYATRTNPFIVGGEETQVGELPFMVSLHDRNGHFCGGSLVAKNWVLTAAHCVRGTSPNGIEAVYVGLHDQKSTQGVEAFKAVEIIINPNYNYYLDFDFALIRLEGESKSEPAELNEYKFAVPADPDTIYVTTAGWGVTREGGWSAADILRKVTVPLVTQETCLKSYPGRLTDRMICAGLPEGGKDACQMDSGGPLFTKKADGRFTLIGVVSWGEGCARPERFGVYSRVSSVLDWLKATIRSR